MSDGRYALTERQQLHAAKVIKMATGDTLRIGVLNGEMGEGMYQAASEKTQTVIIHSLVLFSEPLTALPMVLVMSLPPPNMPQRTVQKISAVEETYLIHSAKVKKSYWQSSVLQDDTIRQSFLDGLEQVKNNMMPVLAAFSIPSVSFC